MVLLLLKFMENVLFVGRLKPPVCHIPHCLQDHGGYEYDLDRSMTSALRLRCSGWPLYVRSR